MGLTILNAIIAILAEAPEVLKLIPSIMDLVKNVETAVNGTPGTVEHTTAINNIQAIAAKGVVK